VGDLATGVALWSLAALRCLVPVPHLLILHGGVGSRPLGAVVGVVTDFPTMITAVARRGARRTGSRWRANRSHRAVLRVGRAWSLRPWTRKLLRSALELLILLWLVLIRLLTIASVTPAFLSLNKSPNKSCVFSKLTR
jgi:hypothetical protein